MSPTLTLVTGTRNRPEGLKRLLDSIVKHTDIPYEVIVGDASDAAYDGPVPDKCTIVAERPRMGHSRGYNRCFRMANAEWILWLNDDAEVTAGYASRAVAFMEKHPFIGLGCLPYSENGSPFHCNAAWKTMYANFGIFKKSLGEQVGYFDEELEMYGADNSLAIRILMAGKGIAAIHDARILHHSENDEVRKQNQSARMRDNRILNKKYFGHMNSWQRVYERFRLPGEEPWPHGIQPARDTVSR